MLSGAGVIAALYVEEGGATDVDERPLAIDLFCGLGGWTEGLLAEGYRVIGYDIEAHEYDGERYPAELVLADVLELHGSAFKDAALIVASPPCQEYSYMAMPWSKAKAKAAAIRADTTGAEVERLNRLFNACFRIQREACAAAGHHIPMVVENVRGAIPWVGRSRWNYGSFHLWGDVPALMPSARAVKVPSFRFDGSGGSFQTASVEHTGVKVPGLNWSDPDARKPGPNRRSFTDLAGRRTAPGKGARFTSRDCGVEASGLKGYVPEGTKALGKHGHPRILPQIVNKTGSGSSARKAASARIAKIPLPLSRWIAAHYLPRPE